MKKKQQFEATSKTSKNKLNRTKEKVFYTRDNEYKMDCQC